MRPLRGGLPGDWVEVFLQFGLGFFHLAAYAFFLACDDCAAGFEEFLAFHEFLGDFGFFGFHQQGADGFVDDGVVGGFLQLGYGLFYFAFLHVNLLFLSKDGLEGLLQLLQAQKPLLNVRR